jgi:serine protease
LQQMFLRLVRATARRPAGWDPFEMGAGIVDARALLGADLDLGRDRESVQPPDPVTEPEFAVAGLVAEVVGVDAAPDPDLDWHRYGPELALVLLDAQLNAASVGEGDVRPEGTALEVSGELAGALTNPRLRDHLGLDDGLAPEVGEVRPS